MKLSSFAQIQLKLLDHTQMLLIHPNVSNFTQSMNEAFNRSKFDEGCWNYQMIPVRLKAVSILPSEAKKNGKIVSAEVLPLMAK